MKAVTELAHRLDRHENAYWFHYIMATRALERGNAGDFVQEMLSVWLSVVVPLEATYQTLDNLALSDEPNSGFLAALPYVYENTARMIVLRSQEKGVDRELDPLGAIVRLLYDGRVGAYPEVIPAAASSRAYLERIVARMDGPESDVGSLTFTLALLEASKHHEHARGLLARDGLTADTQRALRTTTGAYEIAFKRALTVEGQCAVYTRVLREIGEVYVAKQRLNAEFELEMPFSIEGAIGVWATLRGAMHGDWQALGYQNVAREQYRVEGFLLDLDGEVFSANRSIADLRDGISERVEMYFSGFANFRVGWEFEPGTTCASAPVAENTDARSDTARVYRALRVQCQEWRKFDFTMLPNGLPSKCM